MKNILFIIPTLGGGGAEKVLIDILNNMNYKKYNVTLLLHCKSGVHLESVNSNVKIKNIYDPNKFKARYIHSIYYRIVMYLYNQFPKVLYSLLIRHKQDVEIAFLEGEAVKFLNNSNNENSKKIAWIHTDFNTFDRKILKDNFKYYQCIDKVVCVSNDAKKSFQSVYPEYKDKATVIYNLIDKETIIKKANLSHDNKLSKNTILGIGRLVKEKRFDVLIKAHKLLLEDGINNELVIIGNGNEEENLKILIKELGIEDSVKLIGFKANPYPYIKQCDVFVLSSEVEGFSLVLCESIILGKAIVSTDCTGPREILNDGEFGLLSPKNDEINLKENIKKLILDEELKTYYGNKSIERSKIFNVEETMNQINQLINY